MDDVPSHDKLMWPTLLAIRDLGGSATISEISSGVIELLKFLSAFKLFPTKMIRVLNLNTDWRGRGLI